MNDLLAARTGLLEEAKLLQRACAPLPPDRLVEELLAPLAAASYVSLPSPNSLDEVTETLQQLPAILVPVALQRVKATHPFRMMPLASEILKSVAEERGEVRLHLTLLKAALMAVEGQLAERAKKSPKPSNGAPAST